MLDGESFQKVEAVYRAQRGVNQHRKELTETVLILLAFVDHADEEVALAAKDGVDSHFELDVAIKDVQGCLTENYAVLSAILLEDFIVFF